MKKPLIEILHCGCCGREEEGCEGLYVFAALFMLPKGEKVFVVEGSSVTEGVSIAAMLRLGGKE